MTHPMEWDLMWLTSIPTWKIGMHPLSCSTSLLPSITYIYIYIYIYIFFFFLIKRKKKRCCTFMNNMSLKEIRYENINIISFMWAILNHISFAKTYKCECFKMLICLNPLKVIEDLIDR